ncbi:MAG TPA: hypothetical protein VMW83_00870 [Spirochaetia bacterium]|nr:hypothetical protein [Spirochaetia bacterium]
MSCTGKGRYAPGTTFLGGPAWSAGDRDFNYREDLSMALVALLVTLGSGLLSFLVVWQVKTVSPVVGAVARYNLVVLPLLYVANVLLGGGFVKAHTLLRNLPLVAAGQSFVYNVLLLVFSVLILGDRIPLGRSLAGFLLIAAGAAVLAR